MKPAVTKIRRPRAAGSRRALIVLALVFAALVAGTAQAQAATLAVDDDGVQCPNPDYSSIKDAVEDPATQPGDVIKVCPGSYDQSVTVDKPGLVLQGPGVDADCFQQAAITTDPTQQAIVDAGAGATSFRLDADNLALSGFVVQGASIGIETSDSHSGYQVHDNLVQLNVDPTNSTPSATYRGFGLDFGSSGEFQSRVDHNCFRQNGLGGVVSELDDDYITNPRQVTPINNRTHGRDLRNALIDQNDSFQNPEGLIAAGPGSRSDVTIADNTSTSDRFGVGISNSTGSGILRNAVTGAASQFQPKILLGGANTGLQVGGNQVSDGSQGIALSLTAYIDRFPVGCAPGSASSPCTPTSGLNLHDNTVTDSRQDGIIAAPFAVTTSQFHDNTSNHNALVNSSAAGITLRPGNTDNSLLGNTAWNNVGYGIYACSPGGGFTCNRGDSNSIVSNSMHGNAAYDARDDNLGATNAWIKNDCDTALTPNYTPKHPICAAG